MTNINEKKQLLATLDKSASAASLRSDDLALTLKPDETPRNVSAPQGVQVSFFFDGTGNNLEADRNTNEHSNVARLFLAHAESPTRFYVPGIGTYFREIGDPGGTALGNGAGARGEDRLKWAMTKLEQCLARSDGRQTIHVALFGFSRGATLARAFAVRIARNCQRRGDGVWRLTLGQRTSPIRVYFMGLFDSVASVGLLSSMNNTTAILTGVASTRAGMMERNSSDLAKLAFGDAPGADPTPGLAHGHNDWAKELRIPEMVEDCLHLVAGHEIRNSFPVDSLLEGLHYPHNCREMVYPGAHSNVGGGYRPGEGARSRSSGALLSMIPLRVMRAQAIQAGVPLRHVPQDPNFAEDAGNQEAFALLQQRFTAYMDKAGWGEQPLGTQVLSHMKLYYQWRFHRLVRDSQDRAAGRPTKDQSLLGAFERGWKADKAVLAKDTEALKRQYFAQAQHTAEMKTSFGAHQRRASIEKQQDATSAAQHEYLSLQARLDTMPGTDGSFLDRLYLYDSQLLDDVRALQALVRFRGDQKLRPHYRQMLQAYEAEQRGQGLRDMNIIQFFDTYVHDSLAGFGMDATLPSDPRVIYAGGNAKHPYAMSLPRAQSFPRSALG